MRKVPEPVNVTEQYLHAIVERLDALLALHKKEEEVLIASTQKETANIRTPRKKKGE